MKKIIAYKEDRFAKIKLEPKSIVKLMVIPDGISLFKIGSFFFFPKIKIGDLNLKNLDWFIDKFLIQNKNITKFCSRVEFFANFDDLNSLQQFIKGPLTEMSDISKIIWGKGHETLITKESLSDSDLFCYRNSESQVLKIDGDKNYNRTTYTTIGVSENVSYLVATSKSQAFLIDSDDGWTEHMDYDIPQNGEIMHTGHSITKLKDGSRIDTTITFPRHKN